MGILRRCEVTKECWHCKKIIRKGQLEYVTPKRGARHSFGNQYLLCITAEDVGRTLRSCGVKW